MSVWDIKCKHCEQEFNKGAIVEAIQRAGNGVIHIRGECPKCRSWVKWIPYSESKVVAEVLNFFEKWDIDYLRMLKDTVIYDDIKKEVI